MLDFIRIACAVPKVKVGDVSFNADAICAMLRRAEEEKVDLIVFPELALTGYTCGDLFFQDTLWQGVRRGLRQVAFCSGQHPNLTAVVGLPVRVGSRLYNCAAVIARGEVVGLVPKTHLTDEETRCFTSGSAVSRLWLTPEELGLAHSEDYYTVPMAADLLLRLGDDAMLGIEICKDAMVAQPRCAYLAANGAEIIVNPAASHELVGKRSYRRDLVKHHSEACTCIYAFTSAGPGESTSEFVFSGHSLVAENGTVLQESRGFLEEDYLLVTDCDLGQIRADRLKKRCYGEIPDSFLVVPPYGDTLRSDGSRYPVNREPFVPAQKSDCLDIFRIQAAGLARRLQTVGAKPVIGVSGGLDSTLALLVAVEAVRRLGKPATEVLGVTMPCFGTTGRTYRNAMALMEKLGITVAQIDIRAAVEQHFRDIGHDPAIHDTTYENAQARERTQVLMDYAGKHGGIVVGTGDLSELALGWCTYNGDHMSMYAVNASIPKTLLRYILEAVGNTEDYACVREILLDILDTPISPELLPPDDRGTISQQTEDLVGPYVLHDFYLYYSMRYGFGPQKLLHLAKLAFAGTFDGDALKKWLRVFYKRFFTQQFKRSCMPEGIRVGELGFSPRADWHMPGDASVNLWLQELDAIQ